MNPLTFFRGFHFCELRMDLLNSLQVKVFKIYDLEHCEWTCSLLQKGDLCSERVKIHYVSYKPCFEGLFKKMKISNRFVSSSLILLKVYWPILVSTEPDLHPSYLSAGISILCPSKLLRQSRVTCKQNILSTTAVIL